MADKKQNIDKDLIRELAALLKETDLTEIEVEQDDFRVRVSRGARTSVSHVAVSDAPTRAPTSEARSDDDSAQGSLADPARHPGCVPSPMVGTVYRSPDPNAPPFVEVGDVVAVGQTILIVEAMKHMNEVGSPRAGKVVEIMVSDGQPVEFGEPLMIIE